jgi:putative endonuclease
MYYVYALFNKDANRVYVGYTGDIKRRLLEHNSQNNHYTGKIIGQWKLVYSEEISSRSAAMAREKQLKSHCGREFIRTQLNNQK